MSRTVVDHPAGGGGQDGGVGDSRAIAARVSAAVADGSLDLPRPGCGQTGARYRGLSALGRRDLSLARLAEGHVDAIAILAEAGRPPVPETWYGVWAASSSDARLRAEPVAGGWHLVGRKPFCSGATSVGRALVTASSDGGDLVFEIDPTDAGVTPVPGTWPAIGMSGSDSQTLRFDVTVRADDQVGPPGFYVGRPGFWWGAVGVAACWFGGAARLIDDTIDHLAKGDPGPHALADLGAMVAAGQAMASTLRWAADRFDDDPADAAGAARQVATTARHVVHDRSVAVLAGAAAAGGARPLCHDGAHARVAADLPVYLSQYHGGRDAAVIGRGALERGW